MLEVMGQKCLFHNIDSYIYTPLLVGASCAPDLCTLQLWRDIAVACCVRVSLAMR